MHATCLTCRSNRATISCRECLRITMGKSYYVRFGVKGQIDPPPKAQGQKVCTFISHPIHCSYPYRTHTHDVMRTQTWKAAVSSLSTNSISSCGLWLNLATLGGIPSEVSRHNTPSRAHALTKTVQCEAKIGQNVAIIVSGLILLYEAFSCWKGNSRRMLCSLKDSIHIVYPLCPEP